MKNLFLAMFLLVSLHAENNSSNESNVSSENNITVEDINKSSETNLTKEEKADKQLQKQMEREKKFAKEQTFYQGKEYDLSYAEVNQDSIDSVSLIEPDYDFDMDDVYD